MGARIFILIRSNELEEVLEVQFLHARHQRGGQCLHSGGWDLVGSAATDNIGAADLKELDVMERRN